MYFLLHLAYEQVIFNGIRLQTPTGMNISMHKGENEDVYICSMDIDNLEDPSSNLSITHLRAPTSHSTMSIHFPRPIFASQVRLYLLQPNCYALWCEGTSFLLVVDDSQPSPRVVEIELSTKFSHLLASISQNLCRQSVIS